MGSTASRASTIPARLLALALWISAPLAAQVWEVGNRLLQRDPPSAYAGYGRALAVGDFDGDGIDDLAISAANANLVEIFRGSAGGLGATPWKTVTGGQEGMAFGLALAAGSVDDDAADELVIGAPFYDVTVSLVAIEDAGGVWVVDFESGEPQASGFNQATTGVLGTVEELDFFGSTISIGDFDDDGFGDLAVGATFDDAGAVDGAGTVAILYGSATGTTVSGNSLWSRSGGGITGTAHSNSFLGTALASGDFDSDGIDDLAIGASGQTIDGVDSTGEVVVLFGSLAGLTSAGQQAIDPLDLGGVAEAQRFGTALAAGEFNPSFGCAFSGTCADDLAISAEAETVNYTGNVFWAGRVHLLLGSESAGGLSIASHDSVSQASLDPATTTAPEFGDFFGASLAVGELDGRSGIELVIGTPDESFEGVGETGAVHLLHGASGVLSDRASQFLYLRPGLAGAPQQLEDRFGNGMAIGDFDDDGAGDLAIALTGRDADELQKVGAVQLLYGALFADGFGRGSTGGWPLP